MPAPRWKIGKLKNNMPFSQAADRIMHTRILELRRLIVLYQKVDSAENLHQIRIALRRLRYSMELFISVYPRKRFRDFYRIIESLQNLTGDVRDAYIFNERLRQLQTDGPAIDTNIPIAGEHLLPELKNALACFITCRELQYFLNLTK